MNAHHHSHHSNHHVAERTYQVNFGTHPGRLEAGKAAILSFRPAMREEPHAEVELQFVYEKQMHLIVVSRDLSYFAHLHPLANGEGSYSVSHVFSGTSTAPATPLTERPILERSRL